MQGTVRSERLLGDACAYNNSCRALPLYLPVISELAFAMAMLLMRNPALIPVCGAKYGIYSHVVRIICEWPAEKCIIARFTELSMHVPG